MRYWQQVENPYTVINYRPVGAAYGDWIEVRVAPLDAIVIERADLPEVKSGGRGGAAFTVGDDGLSMFIGDTTESARAIALRWLAAAEYLREHPPVDETQVAAGAAMLKELDYMKPESYARELVKRGVVFPVQS